MICAICGGNNKEKAKFCKLCGARFYAHEEDSVETVQCSKNISQTFLCCPNCGQYEGLNKVSCLCEEKFSAPERPKTEGIHILWWIIPFISPFNAIGIWFAPMSKKIKLYLAVSAVLSIAAWTLKFHVEESYTGASLMLEQELPQILGFTVLDLPFLVMLLLLVIYYVGIFKEKRQRKENQKLMPDWEEKMFRWNSLYYCPKCNSVFPSVMTGQKNFFAPADDIKSLL